MNPLAMGAGTALLAVAAGTVVPASEGTVRAAAVETTITVHADQPRGAASQHLLGVNHHYDHNGFGLWNQVVDAPEPEVVAGARRAGVDSLRFPGGTVASLYDWKRGIGDLEDRPCQVDGALRGDDRRPPIRDGLAFGSDEFMRFVDLIDAEPLIMVPFVNGTAADAADWVEYMNSPADARGNPNGGVDWADLRAANGHPRPYGVRRWEIGNELSHGSQRFWMAARAATAVRQYAFGDDVTVRGEPLGKDCDHPAVGSPSDGGASQVFETLYWPLVGRSVRVTVARQSWTRVAGLAARGPRAKVFTVSAGAGKIRFGDGTHGAIPPRGATVRATYRLVHQGFFDFARKMKAVDPGIKVCSAWGTNDFLDAAGRRSYSCLTTHVITSFNVKEGGWSGPLEGHDEFMVTTAPRRAKVARLLEAKPARIPLWLTEFSTIRGDKAAFPGWATSASHALHMATLWGDFLEMRLPWVMSDDLLWHTDRAVIGPSPDFVFTADAVTRQALVPMFTAGGKVLASGIQGNPLRDPPDARGTYRGLAVTATRAPDGGLFVMVLNRLPSRDLTARVELDGFRSRGTAVVRTVSSASFADWNRPGKPPSVTMKVREQAIQRGGFTHTFPATSTTVFRIPAA